MSNEGREWSERLRPSSLFPGKQLARPQAPSICQLSQLLVSDDSQEEGGKLRDRAYIPYLLLCKVKAMWLQVTRLPIVLPCLLLFSHLTEFYYYVHLFGMK